MSLQDTSPDNGYLLTSVVATGYGNAASVKDHKCFLIFFAASGNINGGASIDIETMGPDGNWYAISSVVFSSTKTSQAPIPFEGAYYQIRANVTSWVDGTYTVMILKKA